MSAQTDQAADRDNAPQFALPLVIRIERAAPPSERAAPPSERAAPPSERAAPPSRTDALEAAARAVLILLTDPRATEGEWADQVRAWENGRIRKVVRRARGAAWRRALALPGITVTQGSAELRVYPPVPAGAWPEELARLQVGGTELADPSPPPGPGPETPVLWLNPRVPMTAGKAMAQAGHAAQLAWWQLPGSARAQWHAAGFDLAVRTASAERWPDLLASGLPVVRDGGLTEVTPGTCTVVADHPALRRQRLHAEPQGSSRG